MGMESQAELLSPALAVGTLQLRSREVVQFHFLHQERARHDGTVFFFLLEPNKKGGGNTDAVRLSKKHNQWAELL